MEKEREPSWFLGIMGIIFSISIIIFLGLYLSNVDISDWIDRDNYSDVGEFYKQFGLFFATWAGFLYFLIQFAGFIDYLPPLQTKKRKKKRDKKM